MPSKPLCVPATLALAHEIGLQQPVLARLHQVTTPHLLDTYAKACEALTVPSLAQDTWRELDAQLSGTDADGMQQLALFLAAACITREKYQQAGIADAIFLGTMSCFERFLYEAHARAGAYVFNRGYWAWRHLSFQLFRLGTLEFEYCLTKQNAPLPRTLLPGQPMLSVHIPSDATLSQQALHASYRQANAFFAHEAAVFCRHGAPKAIYCYTWLLSKPLRTLLPQNSGIRRFGDDYDIYAEEMADESFYLWLFAGKKPLDALPRDTSLQRTVIDFLRTGGKLGAGYGIVKTEGLGM